MKLIIPNLTTAAVTVTIAAILDSVITTGYSISTHNLIYHGYDFS
jgi:hypothetical protein